MSQFQFQNRIAKTTKKNCETGSVATNTALSVATVATNKAKLDDIAQTIDFCWSDHIYLSKLANAVGDNISDAILLMWSAVGNLHQ